MSNIAEGLSTSDGTTITDLPMDVVREIALIVDPADTIALRQVHRAFRNIPVRLHGSTRLNAEIIQRYPDIYSFTGFEYGMKWFFDLHLTHPGYNNIRRLEINRAIEVCGPLPWALEELSINNDINDYDEDDTHIDLSTLKRLRVLKCTDYRATFLNLPNTIDDLEIDGLNINNFDEYPRRLRRLKVTNEGDSGSIVLTDFLEFCELESLDVFSGLQFEKLPQSLLHFSCYGINIVALGLETSISKVIMRRPNAGIPWDPYVHLETLRYPRGIPTNLTKFHNLETIATFPYDKYKLPKTITKFVANYSMPVLTGLHCLQYFKLRGRPDVTKFNIGDIPTTLTRLNLDNVKFAGHLTHLDFSRLAELKSLTIRISYAHLDNGTIKFESKYDSFTTCSIANNHKLETMSFVKIRMIGAFPRSLTQISLHECKFGSLKNNDKLKNLHIGYSWIGKGIFPRGIESLRLLNNDPLGIDISNLQSLNTLSIESVDLAGPLPANIIKLTIIRHKTKLVISHLSRLASLTIESKDPPVDPDDEGDREPFGGERPFVVLKSAQRIKGPLPTSLRYLNLEDCTQYFDLTNLPNLTTLIKSSATEIII